MKDLSVGILNELYGNMLTDRQREFVRCYYDFDLSLGEIADQFAVTRQAVADSLRKSEQSLHRCEKLLGFRSKMDSLKNDITAIKSALNSGNLAVAENITDNILKNI